MSGSLLQVVGGLGLFLLGMVVMTGALRDLAGDALTRALARFTRSPASGAATGAAATALVQSSSATTLAAVGFVGAGLLTFSQALGIIFGANIGTTVTGWLVALLGFKLDLGLLVLPLVPLGMALHLFTRGRVAAAGLAAAGFGTLFMGIAALQQGMAGFEGTVTPDVFPADTFGGRLLLVGLGIALTLVTQSSSAGVATALAALDAGAISLAQGAAMVIGMDVGTTFTAFLATVGGSIPARRTGYAHVVFNLMTGVFALALLTPYLLAVDAVWPAAAGSDPELVLVGFHTTFNAIGTLAVLPFSARFAELIVRLVPDRISPFAERLDRSLLRDPSLAVGAASATLEDLAEKTFDELSRLLEGEPPGSREERLDLLALALADTRSYVERAPVSSDLGDAYRRQVSALYAIDHLDRMLDRLRRYDAAPVTDDERLGRIVGELQGALAGDVPGALQALWEHLEALATGFRGDTLSRCAAGTYDTRTALRRLDAFRWLRRTTYHAWRIRHHLGRSRFEGALEPEEIPPAAEPEPLD